jgi:hypothetical protein
MNTAPLPGAGCSAKVPELTPGSYIPDAKLPDGYDCSARFVLPPECKVQFLELDYTRIAPPEEDGEY